MVITRRTSGNRGGNIKVVMLLFLLTLSGVQLAGAVSVSEQVAALKAERDTAIFRAQDIVNQPVRHLKLTLGLNVTVYPAWFHDGFVTPSFLTVDVRVTQQFPYQGHQYVTSPLNPGEVFIGDELEFNSMTKYFYTSRSVPKKKLTEPEMLEINPTLPHHRALQRAISRIAKPRISLPENLSAHHYA